MDRDPEEIIKDLRKRLSKLAGIYGKAQIELCSLRRRLGEGSNSGLLKKARALKPGPWISPEDALPGSREWVAAKIGPRIYILRYEKKGESKTYPASGGCWLDISCNSYQPPDGWLPLPE